MSRLPPGDGDVGQERNWSTDQPLLALIVDQLGVLQWQYTSAHSQRQPPKPKPLPRPNMRSTLRRLTPAERAEIDRRNHGGEHGD